MLDTGFPRADVENDFLRARRQQVLATLTHRLRRRPHDSDRILPLDEVLGALGRRGERHLGLQTIRLDTIVGTVDSATGQQTIDAYVTEVLTTVPPKGTTRPGQPDSPARNPERPFRGFRSRRRPTGRPD